MTKAILLSMILTATSFGGEPPPQKQAKPELPKPKEEKKIVPYTVSYEVAHRTALKTHAPFLVFVGVKAAEKVGDPTILCCETKTLAGFDAPCIVGVQYIGGKLFGRAFKTREEAANWALNKEPSEPAQERRFFRRFQRGGC